MEFQVQDETGNIRHSRTGGIRCFSMGYCFLARIGVINITTAKYSCIRVHVRFNNISREFAALLCRALFGKAGLEYRRER